jgi:hypothetical protein
LSRRLASQGSTIAVDQHLAQEIAERDQLWASLRTLRPEIDRLARGELLSGERFQQIVVLLARIVAAELNFREAHSQP